MADQARAQRTPARPSGALLAWLGAGLLAGAALFDACGVRPGARRVCAALVDVSASATRARPGYRRWLDAELGELRARCAERGEELRVLAFAGGVRRLGGSATGADVLAAAEAVGASDVAAAVAAAAADADLARLVLLGDGTWTGTDPAPALRSLAAGGVALEEARAPAPELPDARIDALDVPAALPAGAAGVVSVEGAWTPGARHPGPPKGLALAVRVTPLDGGAGAEARVALPPPPPDGRFRATVVLPALVEGVHRVEARVEGLELDPVPENDRRAALVRAGAVRAVAVLARPADAGSAAEWLRGVPGLAAVVAGPGELAARAAGADVLATWDLDPGELPADALRAFLEAGGTWIALAGEHWARARPEGGAWPLAPLRPAQEPDEERAIALLVDASGSMAGEPWRLATSAAARLAAAARPRDEVAAWRFTAELGERYLLRTAGGGGDGRVDEALARWLAARRPGGPTDVLAALEQLARGARPGRETIAFVLSDGRSDSGGAEGADDERLQRAGEALAAARVRLVVVAVGDGADRAALARFAALTADGAGGAATATGTGEAGAGTTGRVRSARDLGDLDALFTRELRGARWHRGTGRPPRTAGSDALDPALAAAWSEAALGGVELAVRCALPPPESPGAPATGLLWADPPEGDGPPLVALARRGRGAAVAAAALPAEGSAPAWIGAPGWAVLAWAGAGPGSAAPARVAGGPAPTLDVPGEGLPAVVEARVALAGVAGATGGAGGARASRAGPAELGAVTLHAELSPSVDRRVGPVPPAWLATGARGQFGSLASDRAEPLWIVRLVDPATGAELAVHLVAPPLPREFAAGTLPPLEELAAGTPPRRREEPGHPAVPWLLGAALVALLASAVRTWDGLARPAPAGQASRAAVR